MSLHGWTGERIARNSRISDWMMAQLSYLQGLMKPDAGALLVLLLLWGVCLKWQVVGLSQRYWRVAVSMLSDEDSPERSFERYHVLGTASQLATIVSLAGKKQRPSRPLLLRLCPNPTPEKWLPILSGPKSRQMS